MKKIFIFACTGMMLAACSSNEAKSNDNASNSSAKETEMFSDTVESVGDVATDESAEAVKDEKGASASSEDLDAILDEYEEYCDKCIALAKKEQAGDMAAMTEYASLLENAQSLESKLENAGEEMSPAQLVRLTKIAEKMAKAAQ